MRRLVLSLLLCGACTVDPLHKPTPPDTRQARADLVTPTGTLGALSITELGLLLFNALAGIEILCGCADDATCTSCAATGPVAELVQKLSRAIDDRSHDAGVPTIGGVDATLSSVSICKGWADVSTPDLANGQLAATVNFTGRGLDPVVWGNFEQCEDQYASLSLRLHGTFIYTYEPARRVALDELEVTPVTLIFEGTVYEQSNDRELSVHTAVRERFDGAGARTVLIYTPDNGTFTAVIDGGYVDFRGQGLHLRCALKDKTCALAS